MVKSPLFKDAYNERADVPRNWAHEKVDQTAALAQEMVIPGSHLISYDLTWHHNIPWQALRDSWNVVCVFCKPETIAKLFYLYWKGNRATVTPGQLVNKLKAHRTKIGPETASASSTTYKKYRTRMGEDDESHIELLPEAEQLTSDEKDELHSMVSWAAWNIVEGPKENVRTDDPGSAGFDDFRGSDIARAVRYNHVNDLYTVLLQIANEYTPRANQFCDPNRIDQWDTSLSLALNRTYENLKTEPIVKFNDTQWVFEKVRTQNINTVQYYRCKKKV